MSDTSSVLIVDDEKNMRETLCDILESRGYAVSTAADGETAVRMCTENNYDVVLMDVRMPGLHGVEAFRRIRRHQEGVRVIMMSAYSVDELRDQALEEGAIAFLEKPLDVERVIKLIGEAKDTAILVVEEDQQEARAVSDKLKEAGYWVHTTSSPHDALELVEQIRFDIVFIGTKLPAMDGLELYLAIKQITPTAVAIMITGLEEEMLKIAEEAVRRTAYAIVQKPLNLDYVLDLLKKITAQRISRTLRKPKAESS